MLFKSERYKFIYQNDALITDKFLKCAAEFTDIFDDKVCIAAIGENHFLVLEYDGSTDIEVLKERFKNVAHKVLGQSPDFENFVLDNGMALVITLDKVFSVVDKNIFSPSSRMIPVGVSLEYRTTALDACEAFKVIAIAVPINFKK